MKNVYDVRFEKQLTHILVSDDAGGLSLDYSMLKDAAIMLYLYYDDTLERYYKYIDNMAKEIDLYLVSSNEKVLCELKSRYADRANITYILKKNVGRDVSALLIEGKKLISKYKYLCFLHDKKEKYAVMKDDVELWIDNMWGNLIENSYYVAQIISIFEQNEKLGVLAPPDPIGDWFADWYGNGWQGSFSVTRKLAQMLDLQTDIVEEKPPVSLGTAFWLRVDAVRKIFKYHWDYDCFDDSKLSSADYLSYGIERIFPYVAQDAGYDTGEVMTIQYATIQMNYLRHAVPILFRNQMLETPILTIADNVKIKERMASVKEFCVGKEVVYLYGAGKMGVYLLWKLQQENILVAGFLDANSSEHSVVCNLPVYNSNEFLAKHRDIHVIVTAGNENVRRDMINTLKKYKVESFHEYWHD